MRVKLSRLISWQEIFGENFVYVYNLRSHKYYLLKGTEFRIWKFISERSIADSFDVANYISRLYSVDFDIVHKDIDVFLSSCLEEGILEDE